MKVLINRTYGGICLTRAVFRELGLPWPEKAGRWGRAEDQVIPDNRTLGIVAEDPDAWRYDRRVIAAVERVGLAAGGGRDVELMIVDIPDDIAWEIRDDWGIESIHEKHRVWPPE